MAKTRLGEGDKRPLLGSSRPSRRRHQAEAYRRDLPDAEIHLLDTGHFALETHAAEIGALMRDFLQRRGV